MDANELGLDAVRRLRYQSLEGLRLILQAPFDILQPRRRSYSDKKKPRLPKDVAKFQQARA
jgi:hypothetical protein